MELEHELSTAITCLKNCGLEDLGGRTNISLGSGCDLFMKYVTRAFNLEYMVSSVCYVAYRFSIPLYVMHVLLLHYPSMLYFVLFEEFDL